MKTPRPVASSTLVRPERQTPECVKVKAD